MIFDVTFEESEQTFNVTFKEVEIIGNTRPVVIEPLEIIENGEYYAENIDGFNPVKVNVPLKYEEGYKDGFQSSQDSIILQEKTITENGEFETDEGFTGMSKVIVAVPIKEEQEKTVDITKNGTTKVVADEGKALSKVTVEVSVPERFDEGYSAGKQDGYTEGYSTGKEEGYTEGYNKGFDDNKPVVESLEVTENGTYTPSGNVDGYNSVSVNVPIRYEEGYNKGFSEGKEDGYNEGYQASQDSIILQEKTATSNGEITADEGFTGLSKVNVSVPQKEEQEKNVDVTENGTFEVTPDEGYALSKVTANVSVPIPEGYIKPSGTLEVTENGTHNVTEYQSVNVNVSTAGGGGDPTLPDGYVRCGYIQFDGEQIVDTDIICNQNTEMKFAFTREKSSQHYMYGVASSDNTASVTAYLGGSWRFGNKSQTKSITANEDMIYGGVVSNSEITITNSKTTISDVNDFETIGSLLLGSCRGSDGTIPSATFVGKILFFSIWQGSTEVLHLSPVVSTDGVHRFYDEISGNFFDSITDTPLDGGNL